MERPGAPDVEVLNVKFWTLDEMDKCKNHFYLYLQTKE